MSEQVQRALREAWDKTLKHWDIDCEYDRFWYINRGLRCQRDCCTCLRASLFPLSLQLSTTATFVLPVLLRSRPSL